MNCHYHLSPEASPVASPLSIRPSGCNRAAAESDDDAVLYGLITLFDGFGIEENENKQPNYTPGGVPKCKSHDDYISSVAGASYFIVGGSIYGWNSIEWSIFLVGESCEPSDRFYAASYGQHIPIMDQVFRIEENDMISRQVGLNQWKLEPLYESYGDACAMLRQIIGKVGELEGCSSLGVGLVGSLNGFVPHPVVSSAYTPVTEQNSLFGEQAQVLEPTDSLQYRNNQATLRLTGIYDANGVDLSTPFLGEGQLPTFDGITRWIESQKSIPHPQGFNWACPLRGCGKVLRRPHALKDHLLFHYEIKTYQCPHPGCASTFATKCNCDRHIKSCKYAAGYKAAS